MLFVLGRPNSVFDLFQGESALVCVCVCAGGPVLTPQGGWCHIQPDSSVNRKTQKDESSNWQRAEQECVWWRMPSVPGESLPNASLSSGRDLRSEGGRGAI